MRLRQPHIDRMSTPLQLLERQILACELCRADMQRAPNPVLQVSESARILVAGQAPGNLADLSGRPFTDPSGDRLRDWMGISADEFYDSGRVAIVPMGFCFPGYDKTGSDIPPMTRCAPTWRGPLLAAMPAIELTIVIGTYAQAWHLESRREKTVSATVAKWTDFLADNIFVLPHPSWRNNAWLKRNPWFEIDVLPELRTRVRSLLSV